MIAGIRIGSEEISFEDALDNPGIYQEVLGDRQLLVDPYGDWACWIGGIGWKPSGSPTEDIEPLLWVQCPPGSEWVFKPSGDYEVEPRTPKPT